MRLPIEIATALMILFLMLCPPAYAEPDTQTEAKPNILLILTDNTGWGDWGVYGGGSLRGAPSPHIDRLATEGTRLLKCQYRSPMHPQSLRTAHRTTRYP